MICFNKTNIKKSGWYSRSTYRAVGRFAGGTIIGGDLGAKGGDAIGGLIFDAINE